MPQGMVKSLDMRIKLFSKWATAVLKYPYYYKDVKEQRVDGSSRFRNLNLVRCTLIAGKPVLGGMIHPSSHNNSKMYKLGLRAYTTTNKAQDNTLHP